MYIILIDSLVECASEPNLRELCLHLHERYLLVLLEFGQELLRNHVRLLFLHL